MIRLMHCIKKKDGVSTEDFRRFWNGAEFNELIDKMVGHALTVEVKKNLTLDIALNEALREERDAKDAFDATLEIVWQSGSDLSALTGNEEFQRLVDEMQAVQQDYIDFHESRRFFTEYDTTPG
jgi:uncharacterized protein (DUF1501 family)